MKPVEAYELIKSKGSTPELELIISKNPYYSYLYAFELLNDRFELGENAMSKSPGCSYLYANNILKDRFQLGEKTISKNTEYSYRYAKDVLKNRFILGEETIGNFFNYTKLDDYNSFNYIKFILRFDHQ